MSDVDERLTRLEAAEEIRQLASRYALALDCRDLDLLVSLFVPDVRVGATGAGRAELKRWFNHRLRGRYTHTCHQVGNHVIEFVDAAHALGVVYCRAEHDQGRAYTIVQLRYWDTYTRAEGRWLFERRVPLPWYAVDVLDRPTGPRPIRWLEETPANAPDDAFWPSWAEFWGHPEWGEMPPQICPPAEFLRRLRRLPAGGDNGSGLSGTTEGSGIRHATS